MTRDGIPVCVDADIVFRIPLENEYIRMKGRSATTENQIEPEKDVVQHQSPNFSADAVLNVSTGKIVNTRNDHTYLTDWTSHIPDIMLDSIVRDSLERYTMNDFLYPQYWLSLEESVSPDGKVEYKLVHPQPLDNYKSLIETEVRSLAKEHDIFVDYIELGPVYPDGDAVPRSWLEYWQSKLQSVVYQHSININVDPAQDIKRVELGELADIISGTVQRIQGLAESDLPVPSEMLILSFIGVLKTLSKDNQEVKELVQRNGNKLAQIVALLQRPESSIAEASFPSAP
jgi:hypothetical protein